MDPDDKGSINKESVNSQVKMKTRSMQPWTQTMEHPVMTIGGKTNNQEVEDGSQIIRQHKYHC